MKITRKQAIGKPTLFNGWLDSDLDRDKPQQ